MITSFELQASLDLAVMAVRAYRKNLAAYLQRHDLKDAERLDCLEYLAAAKAALETLLFLEGDSNGKKAAEME